MSHEQTCIARADFVAHGNITDLVKAITVKLKGVTGENEFCEAYKSRSADGRADPNVINKLDSGALKPSE